MTASSLSLVPRIPAFIFLNGPAGCGKTSLANYLCSLDSGITSYHHASPLWAMLDQVQTDYTAAPLDFDDPATKASPVPWCEDSPHPGRTYRDALVSLGHYMRSTFGREILGHLAVASAREALSNYDTIVFPGIRTDDDLRPLVAAAGPAACMLLRISRPGHSWSGDIGGYVTSSLPTVDLANDESLEVFFSRALHAIGISA